MVKRKTTKLMCVTFLRLPMLIIMAKAIITFKLERSVYAQNSKCLIKNYVTFLRMASLQIFITLTPVGLICQKA